MPASDPRSAPLLVPALPATGGFKYDDATTPVAAINLTKRVLRKSMDYSPPAGAAVLNNTGKPADAPKLDNELERQLSLIEQYFGLPVHGNGVPDSSTELLVQQGSSIMQSPVMQQQSTFCVPCAFIWVGLALWPWVQLQQDCIAANEADCESEGTALANRTAFIVMAAIFGCCSCFFLMADMQFLTRMRPWQEYTARLDKLTNLGDTKEGCKFDAIMTWQAQHPSFEHPNDPSKAVHTAAGIVNATEATGLRFVTRSEITDMQQLHKELSERELPGAYVHLHVEFVPRGLAAGYLSSLRTLGAAMAARADQAFQSEVILDVSPESTADNPSPNSDLRLRTGRTVQSTLVMLPGVSEAAMLSFVEPFGCLHPFPRFLLQLITLALGLNTLLAGWNTSKLPQVVVTLRKNVWLQGDPALELAHRNTDRPAQQLDVSVDPSTVSQVGTHHGPTFSLQPSGAFPATRPPPEYSTVHVRAAGAGAGSARAAAPQQPYQAHLQVYGAPLFVPVGSSIRTVNPAQSPLQASGVSAAQVAAWQNLLPPPSYSLQPPYMSGGNSMPPPPYSQGTTRSGAAALVHQTLGLTWAPPPGEAGDFYV